MRLFFDPATGALHADPAGRYLELGGGDNPALQPNVDVRPGPAVAFVVDFEKDFTEGNGQAISSGEFDGVFSRWALEHVSWRRVPGLLREVCRVLKPGGDLCLVLPDTESQMRHLLETQDWADAGSMLFGGQDYSDNAHKSFWSPAWATTLLEAAGFECVSTAPFGAKKTDMVVHARKPAEPERRLRPVATWGVMMESAPDVSEGTAVEASPAPHAGITLTPEFKAQIRAERAAMFDRRYFDGPGPYGGYQGYRDYPCHWLTVQKILAERPQSVLELGCGRGYLVKRLNNAAVLADGLDISRHCQLTRACDDAHWGDVTDASHWASLEQRDYDLCFSIGLLDHIPEALLDDLFALMEKHTGRGLHGVNTNPDQGGDLTRCTVKPLSWWRARLPAKHRVVDKDELEQGNYPREFFEGDGKLKLNVASYTTMHHHGWVNLDVIDLSQWAQSQGYVFKRCDVRAGLPFGTESVHLINMQHGLEHLSYSEGFEFLRECRRVLRPDGALRIAVPDCGKLGALYAEDHKHLSHNLKDFDELSGTCASRLTAAGKLYELLVEGHKALYDFPTLLDALQRAGFEAADAAFNSPAKGDREEQRRQIVRETQDMLPDLSLYVEAVPLGGF